MKTLPRYERASLVIRERFRVFVNHLSVSYDKPRKRLFREALWGIWMSGTVKLSQMIKYIEDGCRGMKHREKRLSREMGSEQWEIGRLVENHLRQAKALIDERTILALDLSDIAKKEGRHFEYLTRVHDGSSGELSDGYWFVTIDAIRQKGKQIPLYLMPYSPGAPGFEGQTREIEQGVKKVTEAVGRLGLWVMDRGFDSLLIFQYFTSLHLRFLIRVYQGRTLMGEGTLTDLAETMKLPYEQETVVRRLHGTRRKKERVTIRYGFKEIQLPEQWNPHTRERESLSLTLLVCEGLAVEGERSYFVTSEKVHTPTDCLELFKQYIKRWGCEDAIRFLKQEFHLEDIRVLKFNRIRRTCVLAMLVFAFLCELEYYCEKHARWVVERLCRWAMELDTDATFLYYRLHRSAQMTVTLDYVVDHFT